MRSWWRRLWRQSDAFRSRPHWRCDVRHNAGFGLSFPWNGACVDHRKLRPWMQSFCKCWRQAWIAFNGQFVLPPGHLFIILTSPHAGRMRHVIAVHAHRRASRPCNIFTCMLLCFGRRPGITDGRCGGSCFTRQQQRWSAVRSISATGFSNRSSHQRTRQAAIRSHRRWSSPVND